MAKLDGINISEAAQTKCTMWAPALGRRKRLTQVNAILLTFSAQSANMWNIVHVTASKQMTWTPSRNATAAIAARRWQIGSVPVKTIGIDAIYIDIVCQ